MFYAYQAALFVLSLPIFMCARWIFLFHDVFISNPCKYFNFNYRNNKFHGVLDGIQFVVSYLMTTVCKR